MKQVKLPPIAAKLVNRLLPDEMHQTYLGDFTEYYKKIFRENGMLAARWWIWKQIFILLPAKARQSVWWSAVMFRSYLKSAVRNLLRGRSNSFLNIAGLSIGIAAASLIMLWVLSATSYDRFHSNSDRIFRLLYEEQLSSGSQYFYSMPPVLAPHLKSSYPEITAYTRFRKWGNKLVGIADKSFIETGLYFADPDFFNMFSFTFIAGDPEKVLSNPASIVLTKSTAEKYFGTDNPVGRTLTVELKHDLTVTGVIEDLPDETSLSFDLLAHFDTIYHFIGERQRTNWGYHAITTYLMLDYGVEPDIFSEKIGTVLKDNYPDINTRLDLQPLVDIYLNSLDESGPKFYVYVFSVVAVLILIIACINFTNLSTARSAGRAREVGIRKVAGAWASDLRKQFLGESVLMSFAAMLIAVLLIVLLLPVFNELSVKNFRISSLLNLQFITGLFGITVITGILGGLYPAFYLAAFRPSAMLKGKIAIGVKSGMVRKLLVITQFSLAILLLVITLVIHKQTVYLRTKDLGFNREHMVYIPLRGEKRAQYKIIKNELNSHTAFHSVTGVSDLPGIATTVSTSSVEWEGKISDKPLLFDCLFVDFNFPETFGLDMTEGRFYRENLPADTTSGFVINEAAVHEMELGSPLGKSFKLWEMEGAIIGTVRDFHTRSLQSGIAPLVLMISNDSFDYIVARIDGRKIEEALDHIVSVCKSVEPAYPVDYGFLDERFERQYLREQQLKSLGISFTLTAVLISCLGLFGLAAFMAEQRSKEICVRKILGASVSGIVLLLTKEFTRWIIIANLLAWPVSFMLANLWLSNFAYRIDLHWMYFASSGLLTMVIALFTVSWQTIRAALSNPADTLKYE